MVVQLLLMSAALAVSSFAVGMLPLSYAFSKNHLEQLSVLGTGLLLGAALGVIIPEGLESISEHTRDSELPTGLISMCLTTGFVLMLIVEQLVSPNGHVHSVADIPITSLQKPRDASGVEFDAELGDLDVSDRPSSSATFTLASISAGPAAGEGKDRAFPLLVGLVIHGIADGLALGVANLANYSGGDSSSHTLSFVVFLALILHKAPTSLAFTTSILSTNLPRPECKKYVAVFSSSTPISAIGSFFLFSIFGGTEGNKIVGPALLVSGGTFLYVATVLQPVSHTPNLGDMRPSTRVIYIALGMFVPLIISRLFEHGH